MAVVIAKVEFGQKLVGVRRRNCGESTAISGEKECKSTDLQVASTSECRWQ